MNTEGLTLERLPEPGGLVQWDCESLGWSLVERNYESSGWSLVQRDSIDNGKSRSMRLSCYVGIASFYPAHNIEGVFNRSSYKRGLWEQFNLFNGWGPG